MSDDRLTPLAPTVNVIAGSRYPFLRFLVFDLAGQWVWVVLYRGLGYIFASQWQQAGQAGARRLQRPVAGAGSSGAYHVYFDDAPQTTKK